MECRLYLPQLLYQHLSQVFLDQCVHHPLLYFPTFYIVKDLVTSNNPDPVKAVQQFIKNSREDMIALWKVRGEEGELGRYLVVIEVLTVSELDDFSHIRSGCQQRSSILPSCLCEPLNYL